MIYSLVDQIMLINQSTREDQSGEVAVMVQSENILTPQSVHFEPCGGITMNSDEIKDLVLHRSPSSGIVALNPSSILMAQRRFIIDLLSSRNSSTKSLNVSLNALKEKHLASVQKARNRHMGK